MQTIKWIESHIKYQGLTLLELMIALFIFSIVSVIAMAGLYPVLSSREQTSAVAAQLQQLQMAHFQMQRDFTQMVDQPFINNLRSMIQFDANGFTNPLSIDARSTMQRISYGFQGDQLTRGAWQTLEQGPFSEPSTHVLIEGIDHFEIQTIYLNERLLPTMIVVNFNLENRGHVHWNFFIAGEGYD